MGHSSLTQLEVLIFPHISNNCFLVKGYKWFEGLNQYIAEKFSPEVNTLWSIQSSKIGLKEQQTYA